MHKKSFTVGIVSPGEMGSAVGNYMTRSGIRVISALDARSERTKRLARGANIVNVGSYFELVNQSDIILSIVAPSEAINVALIIADQLKMPDRNSVFVDCNAISPDSVKLISNMILETDSIFVDASIIGSPPNDSDIPRLYVSGSNLDLVMELDGKGVKVISLGKEIGSASGLKMCYAGITKGSSALYIAALMASDVFKISDGLIQELEYSQKDIFNRIQSMNKIPATAERFSGEMLEVAHAFSSIGMTSGFHFGAADIYRLIASTDLSSETPENYPKKRSIKSLIKHLVDSIQRFNATEDH
jgi:3-hydroxyisobutyrate dehydrogenase-like beta-hydroxyacid dehydrogenase